MQHLPTKISPDAIQEALLEVRFEHSEVPVIALGKLASAPIWLNAAQVPLPGASIPEQIRSLDPNMRFLPAAELKISPSEIVRLGFNVLSHHNVGKYLGWNDLRPRFLESLSALFGALPSTKAVRLGLRYINVLRRADHLLDSIYDLNLELRIAGSAPPANLQFVYQPFMEGEDTEGTVRVVTPNFVEGDIGPSAVALIDIDIYSRGTQTFGSVDEVAEWVDRAHASEKKAFFSLLRADTILRLEGN
jgi:uncharacterized protein (TIGR04255 family)